MRHPVSVAWLPTAKTRIDRRRRIRMRRFGIFRGCRRDGGPAGVGTL